MQLVQVIYNSHKPTEWELVLNRLRKRLPRIVARGISTRNSYIKLSDVELRFREANGLDIGKDLCVIIDAHYLPARVKNHQLRVGRITSEIDLLVGEFVTVNVYVQLSAIKSAEL